MKELIEKLEALGFTNYESKVFLALFKGFNMTAAEIAEDAKIPRTSAYDILKSFTIKGICNEIQTPTKLRYQIIDPLVLEDKIEKEIHTSYKTKLSDLKASFAKLKPLFKSKASEEFKVDVELLRGFNRHRRAKFYELLNASSKEVLLMNKSQELQMSRDIDKEIKKFHSRGGVVKTIYERGTNFRVKKDDKWVDVTPGDMIKLSKVFLKQGEKVKLTNKIPQHMAIFDRRIVYVRLVDKTIQRHNVTNIIIKNKPFAEFLAELFNLYWEKANSVQSFKINKGNKKIKSN